MAGAEGFEFPSKNSKPHRLKASPAASQSNCWKRLESTLQAVSPVRFWARIVRSRPSGSPMGKKSVWPIPVFRGSRKLMGGKLAVWSELDSGTELELSIPASQAYETSVRRRSWLVEKLARKDPQAKS